MTFAEMIKKGRENLGVTLDVASQNLGISLSYLSDYENGRATKIKMDFLYKAANFYGLNIDELCVAADKVPQDIFFKITNNPRLFDVIRNLKA